MFVAGVVVLGVLAALAPAAAQGAPTAPPDRPGGTFQDDNDGLHEPYLEALGREGVLLGCQPVAPWVCPGEDLTRAHVASLLTRALGLSSDGEHRFQDVPADGTHADAIDAVADAGITDGCAPDRFCPGVVVSRAQMASFLSAAFDIPESEEGRFTDVGGVHGPAINGVAEAGVTEGCDTDRFCPADPVRRAQAATFLARAMDLEPVEPQPALEGSVLTTYRTSMELRLYPAGGGPGREVGPPVDFPRWGLAMIPGTDVLSYTRDKKVHTVDLDDASTDRVFAEGERPVWSDDGRHVAVIRRNIITHADGSHSEECCAEVAILDREGALVRLVRQEGHDLRPTDWSPDGTTIVGEMSVHDHPSGNGVVEIDVRTGAIDLLTPVEGDTHRDPTYAADGTIAYIRWTASTDAGKEPYLWLRLPDGGERGLGFATAYAWRPGGTQLLRVVQPDDGVTQHVEVVDRDGQVVAPIASGVDLRGFVWAPDGRYLALTVSGGDPRIVEPWQPHETWVHAADGTDRWLLTPDAVLARLWLLPDG